MIETFITIVFVFSFVICIFGSVIVLLLARKDIQMQAQLEDEENYPKPQFKELSTEQIKDIHSRGKLTPSEKVKEWEALGLCAPGDAIGSAGCRCDKFNYCCHDCLVDYANGFDEYTPFAKSLEVSNSFFDSNEDDS